MHCKQDADETKDKEHWSKFPAFAPYVSTFNSDGFKEKFADSDFIFMRWKVKTHYNFFLLV
jgi:hypothetical protein